MRKVLVVSDTDGDKIAQRNVDDSEWSIVYSNAGVTLLDVVSGPTSLANTLVTDTAAPGFLRSSGSGWRSIAATDGIQPQCAIDEDGNLYAISTGGTIPIRKSSNYGASWEILVPSLLAGSSSSYVSVPWAGDGFVWWFEYGTYGAGDGTEFVLRRADYDGTNLQAYYFGTNIPHAGAISWPGLFVGSYGIQRLIVYASYVAATSPYLLIDFSTPSSVTFSEQTIPGSPDPTLAGSAIMTMILPSTSVFIASFGWFATGNFEIWRSVNSGVTWGQVFTDTTIAATNGTRLMLSAYQYDNHAKLWTYGTRLPYIYYSSDTGATWTRESTPFAANNGQHWGGMAIANANRPRSHAHIIS